MVWKQRTHWILVMVASLACAQCAWAGALRRCTGPNGEAMYSDQPCNAVLKGAQDGLQFTQSNVADYSGVCPLNPHVLRARIHGAIQRHDAVALSGLFLWPAHGREWIDARMFELRQLAKHEPVSLRFDVLDEALPESVLGPSIEQTTPTTNSAANGLTSQESDLLNLKPDNPEQVHAIGQDPNRFLFEGDWLLPNAKQQPRRIMVIAQDPKKPDATPLTMQFSIAPHGSCWWAGFDAAASN